VNPVHLTKAYSPECVEGEFSEVRGRDGTAHRSMAAFVQEAPHKRNRR
jgi:hypothetical protein